MAHRPRNALLGALACIAGLALTGAVALLWPLARAHDNATLRGFAALKAPRINGVAELLTSTIEPRRYLLIALVLIGVALLRRGPRLALAVAVIMAAAVLTADVLKPLVATPRFSDWLGSPGHYEQASWPSGHAAGAMAIALSSVLAAPARLRPLTALLGSAFAIGVSYSLLVLGWHFPSDVLGGFLLAGTWTCLALAVLWSAERRWPARSGRRAVARAARSRLRPAFAVAAVFAAGVVLIRGPLLAAYSTAHGSFVAGALAIAALAVLLASGLVLALRR
jgi:membrane-associated phospholipid phosphatase